ncbi:MAG: family 43 glycosylhydrolase [Candidatus Marinimicrobia bacterium]|nr:family 43 glycosylhydrolase [Candidatus Neomarinimicrobiota bacterium]MCF7829366.1 family 43 glycosylhydrolase [Candidatus Neomarinimicrobiota bacterium]MCF7880852.1 family 43 glycosylhydrolase [Candidatus Neomarinimicrobiota bacterium]
MFVFLGACEDKNITGTGGTFELTIIVENDLGFAIAADIVVSHEGEAVDSLSGSEVTVTLEAGTYEITATNEEGTQTQSISLEEDSEITFTYSTENLDPNLVAHFNFESSLSDITGQFEAGTITGNRINNTGGSISYGAGLRGQAGVFDSESGVRLPDGLITDFTYTVTFAVYPEEITNFTTTFFGGISSGSQQSWISLVPAGPGGETMLWSGNDPWYDATTGTTIRTDEWVHLAFAVDNGDVRVYINGVERFSGSDFPNVFSGITSVFGLAVNYWDPPFDGKMDELRIYDTALTAGQIAELSAIVPGAGGGGVQGPQFRNVSVHDPMVARADDGTWYVFGSHLASAKSEDLIQWEQMSSDWQADNPLIPNPEEELAEALAWPEPDAESTWAVSVIKLNGQYYMYFSSANWDSDRSAIGLAIADNIEGPYAYQDTLLIKKYENGEYSPRADTLFDNSIHPGVIDPHVFFDADGKLWMVYGSYSGGIHILEMDPETGYTKPDQGYGKRIAGGNHGPMEGPYIQYHPGAGYYYLFLSFGTLAADGGYNIRVARSENPDGPYLDPNGYNMLQAKGPSWDNVEPYGAKLVGNFQFQESGIGYVSPGHNSAYYNESNDKMFIFHHTRFPDQGEFHQVRVHQLLMNSEGWPVMAPHRYGGETLKPVSAGEIPGTYQYLNHGRQISADIRQSQNIELTSDGTISGAVAGSWTMTGDYTADITIEGIPYHGVFLEQWDNGLNKYVMTFSALSRSNLSIWGSRIE